MNLDDLRAFALIAQMGSVNRAADVSGVARTTLQRRLKELEQSLGVELLVRGDRGVQLTPSGAAILERSHGLLAAADDLARTARSSHGEPAGTLRVVIPEGMPRRARASLLLQLRYSYPDLCIESREVADPLSHLHEPFDLMLHLGEPPERGSFFTRALHRISTRLFASPSYLGSAGVPQGVADLANHTLLHWRWSRATPRTWPLLDGGEIPISPWFETANSGFLRDLAAAGGGILLAPDDVVDVDPLEGELVPVLPGLVGGELTLRVLSPLPGDAAPATREFLRALQGIIAGFPSA